MIIEVERLVDLKRWARCAAELKAKIRERTLAAMQRPDVREKLSRAAAIRSAASQACNTSPHSFRV